MMVRIIIVMVRMASMAMITISFKSPTCLGKGLFQGCLSFP